MASCASRTRSRATVPGLLRPRAAAATTVPPGRRHTPTNRRHVARAQADLASKASDSQVDEPVPPGCSRYEVELSRPLGLILEENKNGTIVVAEIPEGGKAARLDTISVGDTLISTSALVYTRESEYQGNMVKSGEKRVILNCRGERFDTVMAAISTHKGGLPVTLMFQRC